jgi:hypothetical protein
MEKRIKLYGQVYEADDLFDLVLVNLSVQFMKMLCAHWKKLKFPVLARLLHQTVLKYKTVY